MTSRTASALCHSCVACLLLILLHYSVSVAAQNATLQASAALPLDDGSCPITSQDFSNTDFDSVRTACDLDTMTNGQFCKSCICGLGTAIVLGFEKAGIKVNGQPVSALAAAGNTDALNALLTNCSAIMGIELLQAGALTAQALGQLADCNVNQTSLDCAAAPGGSAAGAAPQAEATQGSSQTPTAPPAAPAKSATSKEVPVFGAVVALVVGLAAIL